MASVLYRYCRQPPRAELVRQMADRLQGAELIPSRPLSDEELLTVCQWMGIGQNLEVRNRIARGRTLTKVLRSRLGQALWESQHVPYMNEVMKTRRLSEGSAMAYLKSREYMEEQAKIRARVDAALIE